MVLVAGALPAAVNGEHRLTQGGETIKFEVPGAPDGPVTGTVTVKYAPCGWEKVYTASNKAVYRSQDVTGNRRYLRVNDTGAAYMRVYGYNTMTAIETGTGNFGNALYWHKADAASASAQRYDCVGDSMAFFYAPSPYSVTYGVGYEISEPWFFGDQIYLKPAGDAWGTLITGDTGSSPNAYGAIGYELSGAGQYLERIAAGTGGAVQTYVLPCTDQSQSGGDASYTSFGDFPDTISGALRLTPTYTSNDYSTPSVKRGIVPGVYWAPHANLNSYTGFAPRDTVPGPGALSARRFMHLFFGVTSKIGAIFVDTTGPWR